MFYLYLIDSFYLLNEFNEYWGMTESRIPLKPGLGGVRIDAISISSHDQTR